MVEINYRVIMLHLKRQMKKRRYRYSDLSAGIQVPEATLQKWFAADDGPYSRINSICRFLGITLKDVLSELEREPTEEFEFTEAQQQLFKKDYLHFVAYWLLAYERLPVEEMAKQLGLEPVRMKGLLSRLDRVGLINLLAKDRLKLPSLRPVRWKLSGDFIQKVLRDWSMGILSDALGRVSGTKLIIQYFQLSDASLEELAKDIRDLEEKYSRRTILEMRSGIRDLNGVRFLLSYGAGSFMSKYDRSVREVSGEE